MIFDEGETTHEHAEPEDFTLAHPDVEHFITDSNNEESVIDKHTIQVGDDLYEEDLPKSYIQYTPHQVIYLQMKDPSLALIINKLQKGTQPHKPLPNTHFLNTDGL